MFATLFSILQISFSLFAQTWQMVSDLSWLNIGWLSLQISLFLLVAFFIVLLPGYLVLRQLLPKGGAILLPASFLLGNLWLLVLQFFVVASNAPAYIFYLISALIVLWGGLYRGGIKELFNLFKQLRRPHLWLILFLLLLTLAWTWPTITTGLFNKDGDIIVSAWLGGERLMMTGHATTVQQQIPPTHPYWKDVTLQYHYFGTVLQTAYHRFGLDMLVANFILIPSAIGLAVAASLYYLAKLVTNSRLAAVMAPVIFFWWDSAGYLMPQKYRFYADNNWWLTVFTDHKHAYINGNSHQFAALFTVLVLLLFFLAYIQPRRSTKLWLIALAGLASSVLVLTKAQAFLGIVLGVALFYGLVFLGVVWRGCKGMIDWLLAVLAYSVPLALLLWPIVLINKQILLTTDDANIQFAPFDQAIGSFNALPSIHEYISQLVTFDVNQLHYWFRYDYSPQLFRYFLLLTIWAILGGIWLKLLGFWPVLSLKSYDAKLRPPILLTTSVAVVSILLTYLTLLTLGNQWQFVFTAYIPLSLLTALVIVKLPKPKISALILTLIAVPTGLGALFSSPLDRTLPKAEINVIKQIKPIRDAQDYCFFALPANSEDPNPAVFADSTTATKDILYPAYAACPVVAAYGPKPRLNFSLADTEIVYHLLRPEIEGLTNAQSVQQYLQKYNQRIVWIADQNRFGLQGKDLATIGYQQYQLVGQQYAGGGQIYIKSNGQ